MLKMYCYLFLSIFLLWSFGAKTQPTALHSKHLSREVSISVYIDGNNDTPAIPFIYLGDKSAIDLVASTTTYLTDHAGLPKMMVIGITDFSGDELRSSITGYSNSSDDPIKDFLSDELLPYLDEQYSTQPYRILGGSREEGAFALTTMFEKQDDFQAYFCFSPTLYQIPETELAFRNFLVDHFEWDDFLYVSQGFGDDPGMSKSLEISRLIKSHSIERKIDYHFEFFDQVKNNALLTEALPSALRKLFTDIDLTIMLDYGGAAYLYTKKEQLIDKYGFDPLNLRLPKIPISRPLLDLADFPQLIPQQFALLWNQNKASFNFEKDELMNLLHYFEANGNQGGVSSIREILSTPVYGYQDDKVGPLNNYGTQLKLDDGQPLEVIPRKGDPVRQLEIFGAKVSKDEKINAIHFDGKDDYAVIKSDQFKNLTGSFSVTTWIKPESNARFEAFISQAVEGDTKSQWRIGFGPMPDTQWGLSIWNNAWKDYLVNATIPMAQWTHLGVTVDQSLGRVTYYINGEEVGQATQVIPLFPTNEPVILGRNRSNDGYFHGKLSGVKVYERVLSANELESLYHTEKVFTE